MQLIPFSTIRKYVLLAALLFSVGAIGYRLGEQKAGVSLKNSQLIFNTESPKNVSADFSLFWDVWNRLKRSYIEANAIDSQKMVWGAISGMVNSLGDPYTTFLPPKENKEFKEDLGGKFEGIGAQLGQKEGRVVVVAPLKGNPAEKAGILAGDWILEVNGEETVGWTVPQAVTKIRGEKGTEVKLKILHENEQNPIDLAIVRDTINVPAVEFWVKAPEEVQEIAGLENKVASSGKKVAYIRLSRFGDRLLEEWSKAVDEVIAKEKDGNLAGLIFDLRNNPGGYLEGSVSITSEFMTDGVVVSQQNSDGSKEDYRVNRKGRLTTIPLVVLINKGSASASEIVAGALKDTVRAKIIGETSFGKGSVQTPEDLPGGAGLHITTGKWLTPKGEWISKKGIVPDTIITLEPGTEASKDAQLAKAIEELLK